MLVNTGVCPPGCFCPPITPYGISARPPLVTSAGMMVCNGRLRGAMQLGWPGWMRKPPARFCRRMPVLFDTIAEPKECAIELMNEQALRSLSTTVMYTVEGFIGGATL